MLISELPEECLLIIFGFINELDDLMECYKEHHEWWCYKVPPSYPFDYVYYSIPYEPMDVTFVSTLFPDLKIVEFSDDFWRRSNSEDIVTWVKKMKSLKGLMHIFFAKEEAIFQYCNELEMLSTDYVEACTNVNSVNIKQLCLVNDICGSFLENAHYFPNLERLLLHTEEDLRYYYDGPIFSRLKIVQFSKADGSLWEEELKGSTYYGFQFMDSCPNLQSAAISLEYNSIFVDESLQHKSLQDLVIVFSEPKDTDSVTWNEFKRLFIKYPNLKHLALRSWNRLTNNHVKQLVRILPNLVLFDVRDCPRVTQKAVNYIQCYNRRHGRTIKFYFDGNYHNIQSDWPHLSTKYEKISQGFDFMKNCFLKDFYKLPTFLISSED
ncbi:uncharacterized protein LOC107366236 isoform X2 [Tetranychus urticae]|uniref:uncharacterized protein LOC107366236 isoform X2 n=1 Tax=Tetranychus urticae TaxID=32264 RepID=UPI000D6568F6|nr:uncharacterized protein LOC107366236 isoform X2 [Tetranychus urticae]